MSWGVGWETFSASWLADRAERPVGSCRSCRAGVGERTPQPSSGNSVSTPMNRCCRPSSPSSSATWTWPTRVEAGQLGALGQLMGGAQGSAGLQQQAAQLLGGFGQAGIGNQQGAAGMLGGFEQQGLQNQQGVADLLGRLGLGYGQLNQGGTLGAGQLMRNLAGQAGGADFNRLLGAYGVGSQQAQQNDVGTGRNLAILLQQLGAMQQATLGAPVQTTPSGAQQGAAMGGGIGNVLAYLASLER